MYNNILILQNPHQLTCVWVPTGDLRTPLACMWVEANAQSNFKEASSSNDESRGMRLCA
jgi:hypothetical protein